MIRPSFLDQKPPPGYIPGIGRGATGFSTRGDAAKAKKVPKRLQNASDDSIINNAGKVNEDKTQEDVEAEQVFAAVDEKLANKHKSDRGAQSIDQKNGDHISQQFADLKRSLADVTEEEWLNIPEAGDITKKHKRERQENQLNRKDYAAPDSLVQTAVNVNLTKLTKEREKLLVSQLDSSILDKERTDAFEAKEVKDYLGMLEQAPDSTTQTNYEQDEDVGKMRDILSLYRKADPSKAEGWIASARLEEKVRRFKAAKALIDQGCQECPKNEDIWLENIRLNSSDISLCKSMVAEAISFNLTSSSLWLKAVDLEAEIFNKCRVIRKALQEIPHNEKLWNLIAKYEQSELERKKILEKSVEFVPTSMELWTKLVWLQDYNHAKKSLNKARMLLPTEVKVWILAAQIEERFNSHVTPQRLIKLLEKGKVELTKYGVTVTPIEWLKIAESLEDALESPKVAESLVLFSIDDSENGNSISDVINIVRKMQDKHIKIIALSALLKKVPTNCDLWGLLRETCERLNQMERLYATFEDVLFTNDDAGKTLRKNPIVCLMYSKELWKYAKNIEKALDVLNKALEVVPDVLDIWLAKIKVLCFSEKFEQADKTFELALNHFEELETVSGHERLYFKYISFLRFKKENYKALSFIENSCEPKFPSLPVFQIQKGQILHDIGNINDCREAYSIGTKKFPNCATFWILLSQVDESDFGKHIKARSDLDLAVLKNPEEESLYLAKIRLEAKLGNLDQVRLILSQALKKFQSSPKLWAENIYFLASKKTSMKKTVFQDALKKTNNSCEVLHAIGMSFFKESQYSVAHKWFERSISRNKLFADAWVWLIRCRKKLGLDYQETYEKVFEKEPVYGDEWISVSKNVNTQFKNTNAILDILTG